MSEAQQGQQGEDRGELVGSGQDNQMIAGQSGGDEVREEDQDQVSEDQEHQNNGLNNDQEEVQEQTQQENALRQEDREEDREEERENSREEEREDDEDLIENDYIENESDLESDEEYHENSIPQRDTIKKRPKPFDPDTLQFETQRKRVPGKIIDKFWQPLDNEMLGVLNKIMDYCIMKSLGRFNNENKFKIAQKYLMKSWISEDPRSFNKRVQLTNLPKISSMHTTSARNDENKHILSYDSLKHRKAFLETYLNAEAKQLNDLNNYYNQLNLNYVSDLNYYNEFQRTIEANEKKLQKERHEKETLMNLPKTNTHITHNELDHINLIKPNSFVPADDDQLTELLSTLNDNLIALVNNSDGLNDLNERLQSFQNSLDV